MASIIRKTIEDEDIKAALAYAALGSSANKPEISC